MADNNIDYLYIGGRVKSTASDEVALETGDIIETANTEIVPEGTKPTQSNINSSLKSQIDALQSQNFVTLTASVSNTTLADVFTGVTIAKNTIYRVANWKGDDNTTFYNTSYYSEYAANDTTVSALVLLDVVNRGVTTSAIENSSDLITSGGVYTELDNLSFSTNEKLNQVGIDDEPTAGSDNLVKSGGVADKLYNKIPFSWSAGAIVATTGYAQSTPKSRKKTDYIDITGMSSIFYAKAYTDSASPTYLGLAFYDSEKIFIQNSGVAEEYAKPDFGYTLSKVAVPSGAVYARFTYWADEKHGLFFFCDGDKDALAKEYDSNNNKNAINSLLINYLPGVWFAPSPAVMDGNPTLKDGCLVTDYVKVQKGCTLEWNYLDNGVESGNGFRLCIYDLNKSFLGEYYTALPVNNGHRIITDFGSYIQDAPNFLYVKASFTVESVKNGANLIADGQVIWSFDDIKTNDFIDTMPDFPLLDYAENGCINDGIVRDYGSHYHIPVQAGDVFYFKYKASAVYWWFLTDAPVVGSAPSFVPGTEIGVINLNDGWHRVVVPAGTNYFMVGYTFSDSGTATDHTPALKKVEAITNADSDLCIVPIDISSSPQSAWMINTNGYWAQSGINTLVPIVPGQKYKVTANDEYGASIAILAEESFPTEVKAANFASGYNSRILIPKGDSYSFIAPQDAKTILIRLIDGSANNITPILYGELTSSFIEELPTPNELLRGTFNSSFNEEDTEQTRDEFCALFEGKNKIESFLFFTDPHLSENSRYETMTELIRDKFISAVQKYYNSLPEDNCICGGDLLNYHDSNAKACEELGYFDGYMRKTFKNYRPCFGNHDFAPYTPEHQLRVGLTKTDIQNLLFREEKETYYAFDGINTKFYVMNSGPSFVKDMTTNVETYSPSLTNIRWEQVAWFANKLLTDDVENSAIVMHMYSNGFPASNDNPATWYEENSAAFSTGIIPFAKHIREVAIAYNNRTSITKNGITYDFSQATGHVLFFLCGHAHFDYVDTSMELPVICTTDLEGGVWNPQTGKVDYALIPTFDNILVDITNNVFYAVRVGAGANRIINLEPKTVSVSNTLSLTTKLTGTVTWESRNTDKATVSSGVVTGVASGIVEILATNENGELEQWCIKVN